ncbi:MAG: DUF1501 domain-containing protein [Planctomycetota bacterium]|nr:DUF1501 domain-containing protein [Planctomycetota bacterium]MDA1249947.1 DUF1501 domain-containing protein [Planctomycetota bacterium]
MLKVTGSASLDCEVHSRRSFVQAGVLGLGGLSLADYLRCRVQAANSAPAVNREADTSVILIWMSGGPGHHETWDPKPDAVSQYRGPFGAISTNVPGMQFSEMLPEQAKIADRLTILRSVNHGSGDHTKGNHWMLTGFEGPDFNKPDNQVQRRPSMGSVAAALRGPIEPGMPAYAAAPHLRGGTDNLFHYATYLGGTHNPFITNSDPNSADFQVRDLSLASGVTFDRLEDRRTLLKSVDQHQRQIDARMSDMSDHQASAFGLLTSTRVRESFDISTEPDSLRDAYGRHTFGQSALLARRLVERGVTFVTVNTQPWDHHGTANRLPTEEGAKLLIPPVDRAIAALVRDLIDRGLYEKTLVVAMGEFGRTPKMNAAAGRDHWGKTFSVLLAGGRLKMGQTIGSSDGNGAYVTERSLDPQDVAATVYHHLGIDAVNTAIPDRTGRPRYLVERGQPIRELI